MNLYGFDGCEDREEKKSCHAFRIREGNYLLMIISSTIVNPLNFGLAIVFGVSGLVF